MMRNHREVSKCRVVLVGLIISAAPRALAQPYEIIHHFAGGTSDGRFPAAALLEGSCLLEARSSFVDGCILARSFARCIE